MRLDKAIQNAFCNQRTRHGYHKITLVDINGDYISRVFFDHIDNEIEYKANGDVWRDWYTQESIY